MTPKLPKPAHPQEPPIFEHRSSLRSHTANHVLFGGEEWGEILDPDLIPRAREEHERLEHLGPYTEELADAYQALTGRQLLESCASKEQHSHFSGSRQRGRKSPARYDFTLISWAPTERILWIVAGGRVRNDGTTAYYLASAYRLDREPSEFQRMWLPYQMLLKEEETLVRFDCPGRGGDKET